MIRTTSTLAAAAAIALTGGLFTSQPAQATGMTTGTVTATTLAGRQAPTTQASRVMILDQAALPKGRKIILTCKVHGQTVAGNDLWYLVMSPHTDAWVSARYVKNNGAAPRWCAGNNQRATTHMRTAVRQAPNAAAPVVRTLAKGARVTAVCSVPDNNHNRLDWYYTTDGNWFWGGNAYVNGTVTPCH